MLAAVGRDRSLSTTKPLLDSPSQPRRSLSASSPLGRYSASAHDDDARAEPPPASWASALCTLARRALVVLCVLAAGRGVWAARAHLTTAIELLARQIRGAGAWGAVGAAAMLASLVVILCYLAWPDLRSAWRGYVVALSACDFLQGYFYFVVGLRAFRYNDELFCEAHAYVALWSATASFLWTACLTAYVAAFFWRGLPAKLNRAPARRTTAGFALVCFGYPSAACAVVAATGVPMDAGGGGDSADSYGCFIDASWCLARLGALYAPLWACMLVTCVATLVTWRQLTALIVQSAAVRRAQFCRAIGAIL